MPDAYGPLQHIEPAPALWLVPFAPLVTGALCAAIALKTDRSDKAAHWARRASWASLLVSAAVLLGYCARLARLPALDRYLLVHLWRIVRFGQLDVSLDFVLDPVSFVGAAGVLVVGAHWLRARLRQDAPVTHALWGLAISGGLLAALADGIPLVWVGWSLVALAIAILVVRSKSEGTPSVLSIGLRSRAAEGAAFVLMAVLFWGAGGLWSDGDYVPDLTPRFAAIQGGTGPSADQGGWTAPRDEDDEDERRPPPPPGKGTISLTTYPGAVVYVDDARSPLMRPGTREPLRAPFARFPVDAGHHAFRIHAGAGLDDYLVTHVLVSPGKDVHLTALGPTLLFRQLRDPMLAQGARGFASNLPSKRVWGARVVTWCALLLLLAVALRAGLAPFAALRRAPSKEPPVLAAIHVVLAGYLMARLAFSYAVTQIACGVMILVGAFSAICAGAAAGIEDEPARRLRYAYAAQASLVVASAGAKAPVAALLTAAVTALALPLLWSPWRSDAGTRKPAALALALAPIAFGSAESAFDAAWGSAPFGPALATSVLLGCGANAFGLARAAFEPQDAQETDTAASRAIACVTLAAVALGGVVDHVRPDAPLAAWFGWSVAPAAVRPPRTTADYAIAAIGMGVVLAAAVAARNRLRGPRMEVGAGPLVWLRSWIDRDVAAAPIVRAVLALQHVVAGMERWIVAPIFDAIAAVARAASAVQARADAAVTEATLGAASSRIARLGASLSPSRAQAIAFGLLAAAVAIAISLAFVPR